VVAFLVSCTLAITVSFSFQAEDGIRAFHVTGVQTCALPISTLSIVQRPLPAPLAVPDRNLCRKIAKARASLKVDSVRARRIPHRKPGSDDLVVKRTRGFYDVDDVSTSAPRQFEFIHLSGGLVER